MSQTLHPTAPQGEDLTGGVSTSLLRGAQCSVPIAPPADAPR